MALLLYVSWLLVVPFWESAPPVEWSEEQLILLLNNSPWAQTVGDGVGRATRLPGPPVLMYLASATPLRQAEEELIRRRYKQQPDLHAAIVGAREEYQAYLAEQAGKVIVVAIPLNANALADVGETKRMERESLLRVGKRKVKTSGHFPPTPVDPILRLIFPKDLPAGTEEFTVEVYLPSIPAPYRSATFRVKDLVYRGHPDL